MGTALIVLGCLIVVGAVVQGIRRWGQGDRAPVLIVGGLMLAGLAIWGLARLLPAIGVGDG